MDASITDLPGKWVKHWPVTNMQPMSSENSKMLSSNPGLESLKAVLFKTKVAMLSPLFLFLLVNL